MADDPKGNDETVRQKSTLRGVGAAEDAGVAETMAAPPASMPPPATPVTAPPTRPLVGPRSRRDSGVPTELATSRYTLGALIGQGGMGEVVLAYDEQIGREVAVKRIRSEAPSAEELSRFVREARVQGRLEHPAVVPVHDLAFDKVGRPYFVMKRLSGTTMAEVLGRLRSGGEPDEPGTRRTLLRAFADVCLAIEFAHSSGIIHRDLKPANIMLGDFGEVYVLDWGIARAVTEGDDSGAPPSGQVDLQLESGETRAGTVLGTPAYMAPEQLTGDRAGPPADIYALGCILYEIAAGEPLHQHARYPTQALARVDARPSQRRPDSPPELDAICERATARNAEDRFGSARAVGNAVQAFLDGDRDVAVRRELAQHHIAQARAAMGRGAGEADRRVAMSAAGRALALDPTATEAADMVTRLILEPPKETPREVEDQIARADTEMARSQGRLAAYSMAGYLAFVPLLIWTGVRDLRIVVAFAALAALSAVQVLILTRKDRIQFGGIYFNACINALLIGLICRMVGPFIIAPTLVTTTLMAYAAHPQFGRMRVVAVILSAGVAIPWGLEVLGVLEPTYRFIAGTLVLSSPNVTFSSVPVQLAFVVLLFSLVTVVALLSRTMALRQRDATRQLELQAWHLRQIVPAHTTR